MKNPFKNKEVLKKVSLKYGKSVNNNGDSLRYVKDQTENICLEAVNNNGDSLRYVDKNVFNNFKK